MPHAFAWPALALVAGVFGGVLLPTPPWAWVAVLLAAVGASVGGLRRGSGRTVFAGVLVGWCAAGAALGARDERHARDPPLRALLASPAEERVCTLEGRLTEDAALVAAGVSLRVEAERVSCSPSEGRSDASAGDRDGPAARGGVALTVLGTLAFERTGQWTAGRRVRVPARLREPTRYRNPGVPDHALALARRGTVAVGSVKSADLVALLAPGSWLEEQAAGVRRRVRAAVALGVGPLSATSAAVVTAILIGDRSGLDEPLERRLQEAGTYHVIAISGGNIAILAGCLLLACRVLQVPWRAGLLLTALSLVAYAHVASGGSSVARATTMAVVYLVARSVDQQTSAASALGVAAALLLVRAPLGASDPGFLLTFGATIALVVAVPPVVAACASLPALARAAVVLLAASAAADVFLLPLGAWFFSRVTLAGLALNFVAVPLMTLVQVGGMAVVAAAEIATPGAVAAGWIPHVGAQGIIRSAELVEWVPALTWRVPRPPLLVLLGYYAALAGVVALQGSWRRGSRWRAPVRRVAAAGTLALGAWTAVAPSPPWGGPASDVLRVTVLDVGQGDATLVQAPGRRSVLVDAGGLGGPARFDVGERVVAPALWALGVRRLDVLAVTHGHPDHADGGPAVVEAFAPREVWEGVPVERDEFLRALRARADRQGIAWRTVQAGDRLDLGSVHILAHHPPLPDWERQRVRNDDSLVLEVRYGDVSIVLPGDVGASVEERVAPGLAPARVRVLKAAHHGSHTSSSDTFLDALDPRIAIVSCGRGNRFGHPARVVLDRYAARGIEVYRTDHHGAVTVETDGQSVRVTPFVRDGPGEPRPPARTRRVPTPRDAVHEWLERTQEGRE